MKPRPLVRCVLFLVSAACAHPAVAESGPAISAAPPPAIAAPAARTEAPAPGLAVGDPPVGQPISLGALEEMKKVLEENIALRRKLDEPARSVPPAVVADGSLPGAREGARRALIDDLRAGYKGTNVDVYAEGEYVVVRVPEGTYRVGAVRMPVGLRNRLKPVAEAAVKHAESFDLLVEGHSDATPVRGSGRSNWSVAFSRAESVAAELEALHVPARTMAITSRGAGLPATPQDPFAGVNRRVELVFGPRRSVAALPEAVLTNARTREKTPLLAANAPPPPAAAPATPPRAPSTDLRPAAAAPSEGTSFPDEAAPSAADAESVMIDLPVVVLNAPPAGTAPTSGPPRP